MKRTIVIIIATLAITGLTAFAVAHGHDGATLLSAFAIIAGLAGYQVGKTK